MTLKWGLASKTRVVLDANVERWLSTGCKNKG